MKHPTLKRFGFLRWILFFTLMVIAGIAAQLNGFFNVVMENDPTGISIAIYGMFLLGTLMCMIATMKTTYLVDCGPLTNACWFISDLVLSLGMIGTIFGFSQMFSGVNLSNFSPDNSTSIMAVIAKNMSIALYTTLVGLISSVLLKIQCHNVDYMRGVRSE